MKRARIYFIGSLVGLFISVVGIMASNSQVPLKDILSFNFVLNIQRVREIITYISSCGIVAFIIFLIISLGLNRKKYEEISNVKKYVLYDFLYLVKKQSAMLREFIPIDTPKNYIFNTFRLFMKLMVY